jgi:hypothetical protein
MARILSLDTWSYLSACLKLPQLLRVSQCSAEHCKVTARHILLSVPLEPRAVQRVVQYEPKLVRVQRILTKANSNYVGNFENFENFEKIVRIQLCLQRVVVESNGPTALRTTLHVILQSLRTPGSLLCRRWQSVTLDELYAWLVEDLQITEELLEEDVGPCISAIQTCYRLQPIDEVNTRTLVELLLTSHAYINPTVVLLGPL